MTIPRQALACAAGSDHAAHSLARRVASAKTDARGFVVACDVNRARHFSQKCAASPFGTPQAGQIREGPRERPWSSCLQFCGMTVKKARSTALTFCGVVKISATSGSRTITRLPFLIGAAKRFGRDLL